MKRLFSFIFVMMALTMAFAQEAPKSNHNITIGHRGIFQDGDYWGINLIEINDQYVFSFLIRCDTLAYGTTYTFDDMDPQFSFGLNTSYQYIRFDSVELTLTSTEGRLHAVAWVLDRSGNTWNLCYDEMGPEDVHDTVDIAINCDGCTLWDGTSTEENMFQFVANNNEYKVYLACYSDDIVGTYGTDDFAVYYTGVSTIQGTDTTPVGIFASGHMVVTEDVYGYGVEAYICCYDSICYHITLCYCKSDVICQPPITDRSYTLSTNANLIIVQGLTNETVRLYDLQGRLLQSCRATDNCTLCTPAPGIYLLQVGNRRAEKVVTLWK